MPFPAAAAAAADGDDADVGRESVLSRPLTPSLAFDHPLLLVLAAPPLPGLPAADVDPAAALSPLSSSAKLPGASEHSSATSRVAGLEQGLVQVMLLAAGVLRAALTLTGSGSLGSSPCIQQAAVWQKSWVAG